MIYIRNFDVLAYDLNNSNWQITDDKYINI